MSISTAVIVEGTVVRVESRTINPKSDPTKTITFNSALIVGDKCMANVRIPDRFDLPKVGFKGRCLVEVGVYRDDDEVTLLEWLG